MPDTKAPAEAPYGQFKRGKKGEVLPPPDVTEKLGRGEARLQKDVNSRRMCWEFYRDNQYVWLSQEGALVASTTSLSIRTLNRNKNRVRTVRNLIRPLVRKEVALATQRVPSYSVSPTNTDPDTISAAKMADKVALYGFDEWRVRDVTERTVMHAIVAGEGFARPFWNPDRGCVVGEDDDGKTLHEGEVEIRTYGSNEVFWEPGVRFEDSAWWAIKQARATDDIENMTGYIGPGTLSSDAQSTDSAAGSTDRNRKVYAKLTFLTEFLERPCPKYPKGRRLLLANGQLIQKPEAYPLLKVDGEVSDEPVLHKLCWMLDPDSDRDLGLVPMLLDSQRVFNNAVNKTIEWQQLVLNPQMIGPPGTFDQQKPTSEPGAFYESIRAAEVKWRDTPPAPRDHFEIADRAKADIQFLAAQNEIPNQVDSGKGVVALLESDQAARQAFLVQLADFHSRVMRHCLTLVQQHYTEERNFQIQGGFGVDTIKGFKGADLLSQVQVRVYPGSLEPRTREAIEQKVLGFADRGWVSPDQAMAAIEDGIAGELVRSYELDVGRAHLLISKIKDGSVLEMAPVPNWQMMTGQVQPDPLTGMVPQQPLQLPGWMPRPFDNVQVQKHVFEDWMKTSDFEALDEPHQAIAFQIYQGMLQIEQQRAAQAAAVQTQMAEAQGMSNAAKPQGAKPMPSMPHAGPNDPQGITGAQKGGANGAR